MMKNSTKLTLNVIRPDSRPSWWVDSLTASKIQVLNLIVSRSTRSRDQPQPHLRLYWHVLLAHAASWRSAPT